MLGIEITSAAIEWLNEGPGLVGCVITATVVVRFRAKVRAGDTFQISYWGPTVNRIEMEDRLLTDLARFLDDAGVRGQMLWEYLEREPPKVVIPLPPEPTTFRRFVDEDEPVPV